MLLWPYWHGAPRSEAPLVEYVSCFAVFVVFISAIFDWISREALSGEDHDRNSSPHANEQKRQNFVSRLWWSPLGRRTRRVSTFVVFMVASLYVGNRVFMKPSADKPSFVVKYSTLRAVQLTSGLSFVLPCIFFVTVWLWWANQLAVGYALLDRRRPLLPIGMKHPRVTRLDKENFKELHSVYSLAGGRALLFWAVAAGVVVCWWYLGDLKHPIMSLERPRLELFMSGLLGLAVMGIIVATLKLWEIWLGIRKLLVVLDSLPLRRGFQRIKGYSWKPIWRFGAGNLEELYRISSQETEALECAINAGLSATGVEDAVQKARELAGDASGESQILHPLEHRKKEGILMEQVSSIQSALAEAAGAALDYLAGCWTPQKEASDSSRSTLDAKASAYERFVCLACVNVLVVFLTRVRTLVVAIGGMYVLTLVGITQYPFEPQAPIRLLLIVLLAFVVAVVGTVFAQIHRDSTLSNITDKTPGELGRDFWLRMAGFAAIPLFALFASQFPSLNRFIYSWLRPAIEALNR